MWLAVRVKSWIMGIIHCIMGFTSHLIHSLLSEATFLFLRFSHLLLDWAILPESICLWDTSCLKRLCFCSLSCTITSLLGLSIKWRQGAWLDGTEVKRIVLAEWSTGWKSRLGTWIHLIWLRLLFLHLSYSNIWMVPILCREASTTEFLAIGLPSRCLLRVADKVSILVDLFLFWNIGIFEKRIVVEFQKFSLQLFISWNIDQLAHISNQIIAFGQLLLQRKHAIFHSLKLSLHL